MSSAAEKFGNDNTITHPTGETMRLVVNSDLGRGQKLPQAFSVITGEKTSCKRDEKMEVAGDSPEEESGSIALPQQEKFLRQTLPSGMGEPWKIQYAAEVKEDSVPVVRFVIEKLLNSTDRPNEWVPFEIELQPEEITNVLELRNRILREINNEPSTLGQLTELDVRAMSGVAEEISDAFIRELNIN